MRHRFITTGEVAQVVDAEPAYWVRVWTPPVDPVASWFVDEWEVLDAPDAVSVVDWARAQTQPGGTSEVFVEFTDHLLRADSKYVPVKQHLRIFGTPGDESAVSETVEFTAE